jgi:hypothetical protein
MSHIANARALTHRANLFRATSAKVLSGATNSEARDTEEIRKMATGYMMASGAGF